MGKYEPLTEFLRKQSRDRIEMTFSQIEDLIHAKLPRSAVWYRAWWSNNSFNNVMTKAWLDAGFRSEQVDMENGKIVFCRTDSVKLGKQGRSSGGTPRIPERSLYGWLEGTVRVAPGVDLTQPPDPELGKNFYE